MTNLTTIYILAAYGWYLPEKQPGLIISTRGYVSRESAKKAVPELKQELYDRADSQFLANYVEIQPIEVSIE